MNEGQISFNCGSNLEKFDENKLINNYKKFNYYDFQGSTWAPTLVHKDIWIKAGGFSEEYFPGSGSDPDFNMKLWGLGIRYFKGINNFKVYHFGSVVLRNEIVKNKSKKYGSLGSKLFLYKWGITIKFFKKHYLRSNMQFDGPLSDPKKNFIYYFDLIKCKLFLIYIKIFNKNLSKFIFSKN